MVIDYHSHFIPPDCHEFEVTTSLGQTAGSHVDLATGEMRVDGRLRRLGEAADQPWALDNDNPLWTLARRVQYMDAAGIDVQVLSLPPYMCLYDGPLTQTWKLARHANEQMGEAVKENSRFAGFATAPMQDPPLAAKELRHAVVRLGLSGIQVLSQVGGRSLDDPEFTVFWKAVADLGVPVFIHPLTTSDRHQRRYYLSNLVGNPTETALAAAHLIFGGVLDRFPQLRFVLAHGGGSLPGLFGRWMHGSREIPELGILPRPLETYLANFYFDTITHDARVLDFLIRMVGVDQVVVGTDYPYDMGDLHPLDSLAAASILDDEQRQQITGRQLLARPTAATFGAGQ